MLVSHRRPTDPRDFPSHVHVKMLSRNGATVISLEAIAALSALPLYLTLVSKSHAPRPAQPLPP